MPSSNPVLNRSIFTRERGAETTSFMTINGVIFKALFLLMITTLSAAVTWRFISNDPGMAGVLLFSGLAGGFAFCLVTTFNKRAAWITAPIYSVFEGLFLGSITFYFETRFPGVAVQAVFLTFAIMFAMLGAYQTGIIRVNQVFRSVIVTATIGVGLFYLISFGLSFFFGPNPLIWGHGPFAIIFSLLVVGLAALNLVLDFEFIAGGVANQAPKWLEWYAAFSLIVTLVWLYLELIRLLSNLNRR